MAPPKVYTYCHTLSLHDAHPICAGGVDHQRGQPEVPLQRPAADVQVLHARAGHARVRLPQPPAAQAETVFVEQPAGVAITARSEEHTFELQSLMRISYAVFCLQKKNAIFELTNRCNEYAA